MNQGGWEVLQSCYMSALMWASGMVYLVPMKNRRPLGWNLIGLGGFLVLAVVYYWMGIRGPLSNLFVLPASVALLIVMFHFWGRARLASAAYCAVWAVITQQMVLELWALARVLGAVPWPMGQEWRWVESLLLAVPAFAALSLTVARWVPDDGEYDIGPRQFTSAVLLLILFEFLGSLLYSGNRFQPQAVNWSVILLSQFYCLTVLYLQNALFRKSAMKQRLLALDLLWHQQKEQYSITKENIALINHKCHDLKHQIAAMRVMAGPEERERYIKELEQAVRIYDAAVQTGNDVLDTVLTEKSLKCEAASIQVHCVADGSSLSFMDPVDLYTVFGNALDNAIEGVRGIREVGRRVIDVLVHSRQRFLVINIINPLEKKLTFRDGLPVTTKGDRGHHGFGLDSIRHIVKKYSGVMTVRTEEGCFNLVIMIPLPQEERGGQV